jgi:hypothetical protein
MSITKPSAPLTIEVHIMTLGRVLEAFLNSSAMWTAASAPRKAVVGVIKPTRVARPAADS